MIRSLLIVHAEPMMRPLFCLLAICAAFPLGAAGAQSPEAAPSASPRSHACAAPPVLDLSPGFEDPRKDFTPSGRSFRTVETKFAAAYRIACRSGLLSGPLMPAGASDVGRLFLRNAPDANTTSIYRDGGEGTGAGPRPMVMEHPFIGNDGRIDIPSVDEIRSAIVCCVHYANPPSGPTGDILECLVD